MTSSRTSHEPMRWPVMVSAVWLVVFLTAFFRTSIQDPDIPRTDILLMVFDQILGVDDSIPASLPDNVPSGIQYLPQRLLPAAWAGLLILVAALHGHCVNRLLLSSIPFTRAERVVTGLGSGLAILSILTFMAGLAGHMTILAILLPAVISAGIGLRWRSSRPGSTRVTLASTPSLPSWLTVLIACIIGVWSVYLMLGAFSPATDFDVREYHLQGPKEWYQQGQITYLRHNVYTSFPLLSEMLCLAGMICTRDWWLGALTGQIVLASFQLLSTLAVYCIGRRWFGSPTAWLAALISLTTPWTLRISLISYAEGSLTFYLIASLLVTLVASNLTASSGDRSRLLWLAGMLAGSAMASKYTGLVSVIIPIGACLLWSCRQKNGWLPDRSSWKPLLMFACGVALMTGPWCLRNLKDTGNPVFPLGDSLFRSSEWSPERNAQWKKAHSADEHSLREIPRHFLDASLRNKWTSGLLFGLFVPAIMLWRKHPAVRIPILLTAWSFVTWWALTHRIDRFWIPIIPVMSLLGGASWLISEKRGWRTLLLFSILFVTVWNLRFSTLALVGFHAGLGDLQAAGQAVIRDDIRRLNRDLKPTDCVLMVGEAEVFDASFRLYYNTVFDDSLLEEWTSDPSDSSPPQVRRMKRPEEIRAELSQRGITHLYVNWKEILRYRSPGSYGYAEYVQPDRFEQLVRDQVLERVGTLLYADFSRLSDSEQATVKSWIGWDKLVNGTAFQTGILYKVRSGP